MQLKLTAGLAPDFSIWNFLAICGWAPTEASGGMALQRRVGTISMTVGDKLTNHSRGTTCSFQIFLLTWGHTCENLLITHILEPRNRQRLWRAGDNEQNTDCSSCQNQKDQKDRSSGNKNDQWILYLLY